MSFRLSNLYNNVNNVFVKPPLNDCNYEAKIAYFGVMLSFFAGVFTVSGLMSYTFCSNYGRYFSDVRKKMYNPFSFGLRSIWVGSFSNKISRLIHETEPKIKE